MVYIRFEPTVFTLKSNRLWFTVYDPDMLVCNVIVILQITSILKLPVYFYLDLDIQTKWVFSDLFIILNEIGNQKLIMESTGINWTHFIKFSVCDFAFSKFYCCKNKLKQFENHTGHCSCKTPLCNFFLHIYTRY